MRANPSKLPDGSELVFVDGIEVRISRKNVKRLRIRVVPPDGHVEASAPRWMSSFEVEKFVRSSHAYICRRQKELEGSPQVAAELASEQEKQAWKELVSAFVPALVEKWAPELGVRPGKLAYRNMKSRWGSCQPSTGRICINTRLALYPIECLEYVVVHELCHLRVSGHNAQFWALVESCLPNYRNAKKLLER